MAVSPLSIFYEEILKDEPQKLLSIQSNVEGDDLPLEHRSGVGHNFDENIKSTFHFFGSFPRSVVNHESGAKTSLSQIVTIIIMGGALLFLTPLFEHIPQCALAAIVISAVITLVGVSLAFVIHEFANPHMDFKKLRITIGETLSLELSKSDIVVLGGG